MFQCIKAKSVKDGKLANFCEICNTRSNKDISRRTPYILKVKYIDNSDALQKLSAILCQG